MFRPISIAATLLLPALAVLAVEVKWPVPPTGYAAASANIPKGTLSPSVSYPTRNHGNRAFRIYMPPGYSATRAEKYPVLYLHHGIGGNENAWTSNAGHTEGNADKVMDYLYAQANLKVTPMLVVMPYGNMVNTSGDTWANFEDVLKNDLIPYIEKTYHASSSPSMRAIAGLSMGGGQTLNFGYKNPTIFNWIGSFSPAPNTIPAATTIKDMAAVKANVRLNYLAAGTVETGFLNTARTYHNYLNTNGVTNLYLQVEQGQDHVRENWNRQLHHFAQRIFKEEPTYVIGPAKRESARSHSRAGGEWTGAGFLFSRDGGAGGLAIFGLDGKLVMQRPAALPSGTPAQP